MRSRTKIVTVLAAGLLTAGAAAPAYAAVEGGGPATSSASSAERLATNGQDGTPDMGRMHEQMMKGMSGTVSMEDMMQTVPGMAKMHEQMMADHPAGETPSAHARENHGE